MKTLSDEENIDKLTLRLSKEYPLLDFSFSDGYSEEMNIIIKEAEEEMRKQVWLEWDESIKPIIQHSSGNAGYEVKWVENFWQKLKEPVK